MQLARERQRTARKVILRSTSAKKQKISLPIMLFSSASSDMAKKNDGTDVTKTPIIVHRRNVKSIYLRSNTLPI